MNKGIGRLIALLIAVTLCFCLTSCKGKEEPPTVAPVTSQSTTVESTTEKEESTSEPPTNSEGKALVTQVLVTKIGSTVPTFMTSRWDTTEPSYATQPSSVELTTMVLTVPGNITTPSMSTIMTEPDPSESESKDPTGSTGNNTSSTDNPPSGSDPSEGEKPTPSESNGSTEPANPSASVEPSETTTLNEEVAVTFSEVYCYSTHNADGDLELEFEADEWKNGDTIKAKSKRVIVYVDGTPLEKTVMCSVSAGLSVGDRRIIVTLDTSGLDLQPGQSVSFTIPEKLIATSEDECYNTPYDVSVMFD